MAIIIKQESESVKRQRLIDEYVERIMQSINQSIGKLSDHADKVVVYATLIKRLDGRVSAKIRRKATTVYHKGAKH